MLQPPVHLGGGPSGPPLRERREDIPLLVNSFVQRLQRRTGKAIRGLTPEALQAIMAYHWPGNVRELKSALEYAFVIAESGQIAVEHLPPALSDAAGSPASRKTAAGGTQKRQALIEALRRTGGNQTPAAKLLGINRVTVWNRMRNYGIDRNNVFEARGA